MDYKGKYKRMAEQFRKDGADEYTIKKWIREEMDRDKFEKGRGITDLTAWKIWQSWLEECHDMYLHNAFCRNCRVTSFANGYTVRKDRFSLIIEGTCANCGDRIARACD